MSAASKRSSTSSASSSSGAEPPPTKIARTVFKPYCFVSITSQEDLDKQTLLFQNRKLTERIEQRRKAEAELLGRIEQLEKRQITDDAVLCVINRYWNQLDEDLRIMLERFDSETTDEDEHKNQSDATTSFLAQISSWDESEMEERLRQRVEFSTRAVGKLMQAFDRIIQRNERLSAAIQLGSTLTSSTLLEDETGRNKKTTSSTTTTTQANGREIGDGKSPKSDSGSSDDSSSSSSSNNKKKRLFHVDEEVKKLNFDMQMETSRLQALITQLEERHHKTNLQNMTFEDRVAILETEIAELKNKLEDVEWDLVKSREREDTMDRFLQDALEKLKGGGGREFFEGGGGGGVGGGVGKGEGASSSSLSGSAKKPVNGGSQQQQQESQQQQPRGVDTQLRQELEEQRELATNRLSELESLQSNYEKSVREVDKLTMELRTLPEHVIVESTEYKCLQSQFSVLYNESMQMRTQLEQSRGLLQQSKTAHLRQIEEMESAELTVQKKLRSELLQSEESLSQTRREYEMLRIEYDQSVAANEQTGPINREMRNLITSLQEHNAQLKGEVARYKRILSERDEAEGEGGGGGGKRRGSRSGGGRAKDGEENGEDGMSDEDGVVRNGIGSGGDAASSAAAVCEEEAKKEEGGRSTRMRKKRRSDAAEDDEEEKGGGGENSATWLKTELTEARLLLDMYRTAPKEQRDKVELMATEKRLKTELSKVKEQLANAKSKQHHHQQQQERQRRGSGGSGGGGGGGGAADDDQPPQPPPMNKKFKKLEEDITHLEKCIATKEQEEAMLLKEMEVTGQAFEDMQDQNLRLLQQLREKDDANFKLMSERIKSNQVQKLLREEKQVLQEQVTTIHAQLSAQNVVVRKLEEKERILQTGLLSAEKELRLRQQAMELHKRKALESTQTAADLKLHLDKYMAQLKELQASVGEKNVVNAKEAFKQRRAAEELNHLRKKMERMKKFEMASSADQVLAEELKEYKEMMKCPSCKVKRKDTVLTKCFHVLCFSCVKTRYDTRQRKCPKCNAAFGAHDFHRIYLS